MSTNLQQLTIQQLAALPRNQGWLELGRIIDLLNRYRGERGRAEFQRLISTAALKRRTAYYLLEVGQLIREGWLSASRAERIGWTKLQIIGGKING